jgi:hypothetical protein
LSSVPSRPPGCAGLPAPRSTVMAAGTRGAASHLNGCTRRPNAISSAACQAAPRAQCANCQRESPCRTDALHSVETQRGLRVARRPALTAGLAPLAPAYRGIAIDITATAAAAPARYQTARPMDAGEVRARTRPRRRAQHSRFCCAGGQRPQ